MNNLSSDPQLDRIIAKINKGQSVSNDERAFLIERKKWLESRETFGSKEKLKAITDALEKLEPTSPEYGVSVLDQLTNEERAIAILTARKVIANRGRE